MLEELVDGVEEVDGSEPLVCGQRRCERLEVLPLTTEGAERLVLIRAVDRGAACARSLYHERWRATAASNAAGSCSLLLAMHARPGEPVSTPSE